MLHTEILYTTDRTEVHYLVAKLHVRLISREITRMKMRRRGRHSPGADAAATSAHSTASRCGCRIAVTSRSSTTSSIWTFSEHMGHRPSSDDNSLQRRQRRQRPVVVHGRSTTGESMWTATLSSCPQLRQVLTDLQNSFTRSLCSKFIVNMSSKIPPNVRHVANTSW